MRDYLPPLSAADRRKLCALALVRRSDDSKMLMAALEFKVDQKEEYEEEIADLRRRYGFIFADEGCPAALRPEVRHWLRLWLLRPQNATVMLPIVEHLRPRYAARLKQEELEKRAHFFTLHDRFKDDAWVDAYLDATYMHFWKDPVGGVLHATVFAIAAAV